eukprot:TRINITY_DN1717_c0_g1_i1.p1 TRINITY_DN1717_c0_g1~~TRINITY_DN1717_c0_g1_i1.p1  ORF type:complete len:750 (-),score=171.24 TRINITY_DN1717_c0_g1_i1:68-2317(-)
MASRPRLVICKDPKEVAEKTARKMASAIISNPETVLGLATGSTPELTYETLARFHREENLSFEDVRTFNLDEYWGLSGSHPQSYRTFMNTKLFDKINIPLWNTHVLNGRAVSASLECKAFEKQIQACGGIDLWLLGIGSNGHIAFNEPGSALDSRTRIVTLTPETIAANSDGRFFSNPKEVPRSALSAGISTIKEAKSIVLIATGEGKADAVAAALEGPFSVDCPASLLQDHSNVIFICDEAAASKVSDKLKKEAIASLFRPEDPVGRRFVPINSNSTRTRSRSTGHEAPRIIVDPTKSANYGEKIDLDDFFPEEKAAREEAEAKKAAAQQAAIDRAKKEALVALASDQKILAAKEAKNQDILNTHKEAIAPRKFKTAAEQLLAIEEEERRLIREEERDKVQHLPTNSESRRKSKGKKDKRKSQRRSRANSEEQTLDILCILFDPDNSNMEKKIIFDPTKTFSDVLTPVANARGYDVKSRVPRRTDGLAFPLDAPLSSLGTERVFTFFDPSVDEYTPPSTSSSKKLTVVSIKLSSADPDFTQDVILVNSKTIKETLTSLTKLKDEAATTGKARVARKMDGTPIDMSLSLRTLKKESAITYYLEDVDSASAPEHEASDSKFQPDLTGIDRMEDETPTAKTKEEFNIDEPPVSVIKVKPRVKKLKKKRTMSSRDKRNLMKRTVSQAFNDLTSRLSDPTLFDESSSGPNSPIAPDSPLQRTVSQAFTSLTNELLDPLLFDDELSSDDDTLPF